MPSKAYKEELARVRIQFNRDLANLREAYDNFEIAQRTGIDPGNLSSYSSGSKSPGTKVLNQFYLAFDGEIDNPLEKLNTMANKKDPKAPPKNTKAQPKGKKRETGPDYDQDALGADNKTGEPAVVPMYKETGSQGKGSTGQGSAGQQSTGKQSAGKQSADNDSADVNEIISLLKADNVHLRSTSNKMMEVSDKLFQLPFRWLDSMDKSNQITLTMAEAHKMMIVAFLRQFGDGKEV